jgi:hypothetical protein
MKKWKAIRGNIVKGLRQQRNTTGQPALKKKRYIYCGQFGFCCLLLAMEKKLFSNIPPPENETVDVAWLSDGCEQQINCLSRGAVEQYTKFTVMFWKSNRRKINGTGKNRRKYFNSN